ncbi:Dyp-type peroxidase [Marinobacterium litorale]|uniref:Dyp-type peroxidase n=1 Tax=Marinobacterium litorale TaxID=404770 RepID=UPI000403F604|nr:Dyp-type peroxidase [Marinobacterium litorale]
MTQNYQSGVIAEASGDALFLLYNRNHRPDNDQRIKALLAALPDRLETVRARLPESALHLTIAVGSAYWDRLSPQARPALLRPFPALENGVRVAPSTPVDLMFIIRGEQHDACFELAREITREIESAADLVDEIHGFRYLDARDMTGFVDGTENPQGDDRLEVALVGEEDPAFAGGSYIHLQRYEHDLEAWNRLPVKEQEDAYGRTKADNIEYPGAEKSPHAHTKRTSLKRPDGTSMEILRQSMPYGDARRKGLMFVSCCRTPEHFELMLKSMVEGDEQGRADRILEFTRAVTGAAFFAPSTEWLKRLG